MNFKLSFTWSYDPLGVISKLRVEQRTTPYIHTPKPDWEIHEQGSIDGKHFAGGKRIGNLHYNSTYPYTTREVDKRSKEEASLTVTEIPEKEFQIYKKRQRTNPTEEIFEEGNTQSTIILTWPHASRRTKEIFVASPSSLAFQEPLDTSQSGELVHDQTEPNIFAKNKEIKKKNELLKATTSTQFWKQTTSS